MVYFSIQVRDLSVKATMSPKVEMTVVLFSTSHIPTEMTVLFFNASHTNVEMVVLSTLYLSVEATMPP
jgi:hypothetical protein